MTTRQPVTELDIRYSAPEAGATGWDRAEATWANAELYWLSTVRPDGRPHVAPADLGVAGRASYFCTGAAERKAKNLHANSHVVLTTGCNALNDGLDLVIEGDAVRVVDAAAPSSGNREVHSTRQRISACRTANQPSSATPQSRQPAARLSSSR